MPDIQISPLPDVQRPLLEKFYRAYHSPMRARGEAQMWVARRSEVIGGMCLTPVAGGHWLTGLFVAPTERGRGVAAGLIAAALTSVEGNIWLFCEPELNGFYQRLGFVETLQLPQELASRLERYRQTKRLVSLAHLTGR